LWICGKNQKLKPGLSICLKPGSRLGINPENQTDV
jgi:hypothetical protein